MLVKLSLIVLLVLTLSGVGAASCDSKKGERAENADAQKNAKSAPPPARAGGDETMNAEMKTLAEGQQGPVTNAFIAVARDAETYAALRKMVGSLPEMNAEAFKSSAIVAAFLGQKRTGGYRVEITRSADGSISVSEKGPPAGAMTTQALTNPFKIISVPVQSNGSLQLEAGGAWRAMMRPYRVTSGSFTMSGGFAGVSESFQLRGALRVMREDSLATFFFDLRGEVAKKARSLASVATGFVEADGNITLAQVDAGTLVDAPRSPLRATGKIEVGENNLTLNFESLPSNVADGYTGSGSLQAEATAPAPQRNPASAEP